MSSRSTVTLRTCLQHNTIRASFRIGHVHPTQAVNKPRNQRLIQAAAEKRGFECQLGSFSAVQCSPCRSFTVKISKDYSPLVEPERNSLSNPNSSHDAKPHAIDTSPNKVVGIGDISLSSDDFPDTAASLELGGFQSDIWPEQINNEPPVEGHPNSAFMVSWRTLYHRLRFPEHGDLALARASFTKESLLSTNFVGTGNVRDIRRELIQKLSLERTMLLPEILIGALATSARQTLIVLSSMDGLIPRQFTIYADSLAYLRLLYKDELNQDAIALKNVQYLVKKLRDPAIWPPHSLSKVYLEILLQDCPTSEKFKIVDVYLEIYKFFSRSSLLYVVDFFTREREIERAIETLSRLPEEELHKSDPDILNRCMRLLYLDSVKQEGSSQGFAILPQLLKLGIRPNDLLHNMVLRNAVLSGLPNVAWDLYRYMKSEKVEIVARSYLLLLKDSFQRQDSHGLHEIMSAIHQNGKIACNPYIVAYTMNIVRVLCFFDKQNSPEESFSHILAIYDRAYSRAPLVKLGITSLKEGNSKELAIPGPAALGFTIWSYILVQNQERVVSSLWEWFMYLIRENDTNLVEAAKHDIIYNGFILFYSRWPSTLVKGLKVLHYMLDSNLCEPTARTWSLMICAFLKHGHDQSADRIRQMMLANDVKVKDSALKFVLERYPKSNIALQVEEMLDGRAMPEGLAAAMKMSDPMSYETGPLSKNSPLISSDQTTRK